MNFVIEKNFGEKGPLEALSEVINSEGNHLVMGYGYVHKSNLTSSIFNNIVSFLQKNVKNRVSIFVGLLFDKDKSDGLTKKILDLDDAFKLLLPDDLFEKGVSNRVAVYGITELHAKFSIMYSEDDNKKTPIAALTGSSNLSFSALGNAERFELDILMTNSDMNNQLIVAFSDTVIKMLELAMSREDSRLGELIEERIHWKPVSAEAYRLVMNDIAKEKQLQEFHDLAYYTNSAESKEDGIAMHESDIAQGICSEYERD